ncbi:MAG: biotin/lipoyl-binding protein [Planctomycetes bacterium]|nr:biotin/lipoyl-binding protein [Planctomycetota bacterium]MCB9903582.1 biotin/lipoyl-binding protein [Planctomycetota bacterium]
MKYYVNVNGTEHEVVLTERLGVLTVEVDGEVLDTDYHEVDQLGQAHLLSGGKSYAVSVEGDDTRVAVTIAGHVYDIEIEDERERAAHAAAREAAKHGGLIKAVMPGVVVELLVAVGDSVEAGQPLLILEAMKMQNEIEATAPAVVEKLHVAAGEAVAAGAPLVTLKAPE